MDAEPLQARRRIERLEQLLALAQLQVKERGDQIGQRSRLSQVHGRHVGIFRQRPR